MLKETINHLQEKKHKISKTIRNNYWSTKNFWKPNIFDIKSVITEQREILHKLSRNIRQAEKEVSNSSLYRDTKKAKIF